MGRQGAVPGWGPGLQLGSWVTRPRSSQPTVRALLRAGQRGVRADVCVKPRLHSQRVAPPQKRQGRVERPPASPLPAGSLRGLVTCLAEGPPRPDAPLARPLWL